MMNADAPHSPPRLGLIGAGRVGSSLIRALHRRGYRIAAVASRRPEQAEALAAQVAARLEADPAAVVLRADLTIIAVPDDALAGVAAAIADAVTDSAALTGRMIVHTSGAHDAALLRPLAERGARIGGLHPALPIAAPETDLPPQVAYAIEAEDADLRAALHALIAALDGRALTLPTGMKTVYHAALVFASNYGVTLYAVAHDLLRAAGADSESAEAALQPLMRGMLENIRTRGAVQALTGPLARGDAGTIARHVAALRAVDPGLLALYRALADATFPLLSARGLPDEVLAALRAALE
ncbi:MAG: Rossmann-like and DUF2520 domain-containing protein [Candidatus Flexifilum sp.]